MQLVAREALLAALCLHVVYEVFALAAAGEPRLDSAPGKVKDLQARRYKIARCDELGDPRNPVEMPHLAPWEILNVLEYECHPGVVV